MNLVSHAGLQVPIDCFIFFLLASFIVLLQNLIKLNF